MADSGTDVINAAKNLTQGPMDAANAVASKAEDAVSSFGDSIASAGKSIADYFTSAPAPAPAIGPNISPTRIASSRRTMTLSAASFCARIRSWMQSLQRQRARQSGRGKWNSDRRAGSATSAERQSAFMAADALTGGLESGVAAGGKAALQSAVFQKVQTEASRLAGLATDNPYVKAISGIAAPILLSVLSHRVTEGAPAPGTVLADSAEGKATIAPAPAGAPERPTGLSSVLPEGAAPGATLARPILDADGKPVRSVEPELVTGPTTITDAAKSATLWLRALRRHAIS